MITETFTNIAKYSCPLCGNEVEYPCFWTLGWAKGMYAAHDIPSCCKVIVGWVWFDELPVYVGTFRTTVEFRQWFQAPGEYSHLNPAGAYWDHETQTRNKSDIDEIPF